MSFKDGFLRGEGMGEAEMGIVGGFAKRPMVGMGNGCGGSKGV